MKEKELAYWPGYFIAHRFPNPHPPSPFILRKYLWKISAEKTYHQDSIGGNGFIRTRTRKQNEKHGFFRSNKWLFIVVQDVAFSPPLEELWAEGPQQLRNKLIFVLVRTAHCSEETCLCTKAEQCVSQPLFCSATSWSSKMESAVRQSNYFSHCNM